MKELSLLLLVGFVFVTGSLSAQIKSQCAHCNMVIKDELHQSKATSNEGVEEFDAIECLVNFLKKKSVADFKSLEVADFNSGKLVDAKSAHYLISKGIQSPMGANLSAFENKDDGIKMRSKKGGEVYSWEEIIEKFASSDFGALEHNHHNHYRPDSHAPIGVMGDHLHHKGGLMFSFRYMDMSMDGNKSGTSTIDNASIFNNFMAAPQNMNMRMYMLGLMYAPSDKLTLMAMQNFIEKDMDLIAQMTMMNGMKMQRDFSTQTSGLGDLKLSALYGIYSDDNGSWHLNGSVNVPIASIEERDDTPMRANVKLPYSMQLGSGTMDYTLGTTLKRNYSFGSLGGQLMATYRSSENSENYTLGNIAEFNVWGSYVLSSNISVSARVYGITEGELQGLDSELNPKMVTTANSDNYGGEKVKTFVGLNFSFPQTTVFKRLRLGLEGGIPVYENYDGIQMDEELSFNVGIKYDVL